MECGGKTTQDRWDSWGLGSDLITAAWPPTEVSLKHFEYQFYLSISKDLLKDWVKVSGAALKTVKRQPGYIWLTTAVSPPSSWPWRENINQRSLQLKMRGSHPSSSKHLLGQTTHSRLCKYTQVFSLFRYSFKNKIGLTGLRWVCVIHTLFAFSVSSSTKNSKSRLIWCISGNFSHVVWFPYKFW